MSSSYVSAQVHTYMQYTHTCSCRSLRHGCMGGGCFGGHGCFAYGCLWLLVLHREFSSAPAGLLTTTGCFVHMRVVCCMSVLPAPVESSTGGQAYPCVRSQLLPKLVLISTLAQTRAGPANQKRMQPKGFSYTNCAGCWRVCRMLANQMATSSNLGNGGPSGCRTAVHLVAGCHNTLRTKCTACLT